MASLRTDGIPLLRLPADALDRLRWWGLLWAAWTILAAAQAAVASIALAGGVRVFLYSLMVFGSTGWLWVATTPFIIDIARRLEWRGIRAAPRHSILVGAFHVATFLIVAIIHTGWWRFVIREFTNQRATSPFLQTFVGRFDIHLFTYLAIVLAVHSAGHWRRLNESRASGARIETQLVATRLHVLMMQLQPHFLFNTLHSISELVHRDGATARRTLEHLRDLLRFSFDRATRAEVPLPDEMRFLETYMEIQRTRFGDRLSIEVDIAPDVARAHVPCLVLQPLVENAIRHGTAPLGTHGHIRVSAARSGERLELRVEDNGRGPGTARREGQGLRNTRIRLSELYGDSQELRLTGLERGGTAAIVSLPFHEASDTPPAPATQGAEYHGAESRSHARSSVVRVALMIIATWSFFGLLWTAQMAAMASIGGFAVPPLRAILLPNLANAGMWALMTAIVIPAVRRWPATRERWPGRLALHAALAFGVSGTLLIARWLLAGSPRPVITLAQTGWLGWDMMVYCVIAAFVHAFLIVRQRRERAMRLAWLQTELATARLDALKWNLQPRFLIDTLDAIAAISITDPDRADDMTTSLGTLLRLMMQHVGNGESTLARELEMAHAYLDIERMRSASRLTVETRASAEAREASLPGMLLLPIVEELIGAEDIGSPVQAPLHVTIDARCIRESVRITIRREGDRRSGGRRNLVEASHEPVEGSPAVGIRGIRSRLAAVYGQGYRLAVDDHRASRAEVTIELPLRSAADRMPTATLETAGATR